MCASGSLCDGATGRCVCVPVCPPGVRCGVADGQRAVLSSARGSIELTAVHSEAMMPGVVSVPHGWGHDGEGTEINVASAHAGANVNLLGDSERVDEISGTAVLNGIPVELAAAG